MNYFSSLELWALSGFGLLGVAWGGIFAYLLYSTKKINSLNKEELGTFLSILKILTAFFALFAGLTLNLLVTLLVGKTFSVTIQCVVILIFTLVVALALLLLLRILKCQFKKSPSPKKTDKKRLKKIIIIRAMRITEDSFEFFEKKEEHLGHYPWQARIVIRSLGRRLAFDRKCLAGGILIVGSPGAGKTNFVSKLSLSRRKIALEALRKSDTVLSNADNITPDKYENLSEVFLNRQKLHHKVKSIDNIRLGWFKDLAAFVIPKQRATVRDSLLELCRKLKVKRELEAKRVLEDALSNAYNAVFDEYENLSEVFLNHKKVHHKFISINNRLASDRRNLAKFIISILRAAERDFVLKLCRELETKREVNDALSNADNAAFSFYKYKTLYELLLEVVLRYQGQGNRHKVTEDMVGHIRRMLKDRKQQKGRAGVSLYNPFVHGLTRICKKSVPLGHVVVVSDTNFVAVCNKKINANARVLPQVLNGYSKIRSSSCAGAAQIDGGVMNSGGYLRIDDFATLTIYGSDFAVDGEPIDYGIPTTVLGGNYGDEPLRYLTGTLSNGDSIDNDIGHNASIILTSEPSTLLLLGLGAMILRRRCRV